MDANELRIGNLIILPNGRETKVGYEIIRNIIVSQESTNYQPVPLTEEWLDKMPEWFSEAISAGYYNIDAAPKGYVNIVFVHAAQN